MSDETEADREFVRQLFRRDPSAQTDDADTSAGTRIAFPPDPDGMTTFVRALFAPTDDDD